MAVDPAEFTDEALARVREELKETIFRMEADIRRALQESGGRLSTEVAQRLLARLLEQYAELFGRAERDVLGVGADVLEVVGDELMRLGIADQLTTPSEALLRAQLDDTIDQLATVREERRASLRAAIVELSRSTVNPAEAVEALQAELGTTLAQTLSEVDTAVAGLDRTLTTEAARDAGFSLFLYDGPVDSLTRPWCRERVGFVFTLDEFNATPNDTGPNPPSQYGGGYNCRHRLVPIDDTEVERYTRWRG